LLICALGAALRAQEIVVPAETDVDNWSLTEGYYFRQNLNNFRGAPFLVPFFGVTLICVRQSGNVYLGYNSGTVVFVGVQKNCMGSIDFFANPLGYPGLTQALNSVFNNGLGPASASTSARAISSSPEGSPIQPLFRSIFFPPAYPASAGASLKFNCTANNEVLFVDHQRSLLARFSACTGTTTYPDLPLGPNPLQVAVTPDQSLAVITCFDGEVDFVDLNSNKIVSRLQISRYNPSGIAISSDGTTAYVTASQMRRPRS